MHVLSCTGLFFNVCVCVCVCVCACVRACVRSYVHIMECVHFMGRVRVSMRVNTNTYKHEAVNKT